MKKIGFGGWIVLLLVVLIGLTIWWSPKAKEAKNNRLKEMTSREVALLCTTDMATQYHIHPEIQIVVNNVTQEIPKDIGIQPGCMTSIHTHEGGGIIHVESPVQKDFTLGDFFAVWKQDFSKDKILTHAVSNSTEIVVTVNGERVETYEHTILKDKDKDKDTISISYQAK